VENSSRLRYCAPEIAIDPSKPLPPTTVTSAADMWGIGVIAFELLTNERVFPTEASDAEIISALRGHALPWEAAAPGREGRCEKLRGLKRAVLACLDRDPSRRPTAESLLASWEHMYDSMKTLSTVEATRAAHMHGESGHVHGESAHVRANEGEDVTQSNTLGAVTIDKGGGKQTH
jgi:serine/threonine protein kinase